MDNEVKHDYRLHGDSMQEVYTPEYQEFLDSIPETPIEGLDDVVKSVNEELRSAF